MTLNSTQSKSYAFYLLGTPRLERDGEPVRVDTRKATAILAYLVMTGQPQSRDTLAALLWPDYAQKNARASLRRTISALHRSLDQPLLDVTRELIGLPTEGDLWVDVWEFRCCLVACEAHDHHENQVPPDCVPPLAKAADLYRDPFMAGFTLRDSVEFDDWQFFQGEALRREFAGGLERLVMGYAAQGDFDPAIDSARRWLSLDLLHEPAHRQLMLLYAQSGQRGAALRQYQECVRILDKELGVDPLEETTTLYQEIKDEPEKWSATQAQLKPDISQKPVQDESPPQEVSAAQPQAAAEKINPAQLPLTGREEEWATLQAAYAGIEGDGYFIVLEGEAGIGKTRLAGEFLASHQDARIVQARCYPGETNLAYAPFVDGLDSAIDRSPDEDWHKEIQTPWLSEAGRLLPAIHRLRPDLPPPQPSDSPGAQTRFFTGLSQVLWAFFGTPPPGILFLDDLHWADEASLDLLTYLVRRTLGQPVLILATWRGEDIDASHRLRLTLAEAQRGGYGELVSLSRLSPEYTVELLRAASHTIGTASPDVSQRLHQETEGLPFFIVEYMASLPERGTAAAKTEWSMPFSVRDLLHSRLEHISDVEWQLLQTGAVIGRSFDFETLREVSGRADEETVATLDKLIDRGLIREVQPGRSAPSEEWLHLLSYDFSHEKMRELVYSETSLARKRLLHTRTAEALTGRARGQRDRKTPAGQIAFHHRNGGQPREAAEFYILAGEQARDLYANAEALSHFQSALALGHPNIAFIDEAIGDLHTLSGNYDSAIQSYEAAISQQADSPQGTARLGHKLGEVYHRLGEWEQAEGYYQASAEALEGDGEPDALAHLYANWSRTAYQRGDPKRARKMAQQALELAEEANDKPALAQAYNILGILARSQDELAGAIVQLEHSLALADEVTEPGARIAALNNLSLVYADQDDLERAIECALKALDLCSVLGDRHHEAALHNNLADLYHSAGRGADSMAHLKKAVGIFSEVGGDPSGSGSSRANPEIWKLTEW